MDTPPPLFLICSLVCEFKSTGKMDLPMPEPVYMALSELWEDPGVQVCTADGTYTTFCGKFQEAFKRRLELYVPDSAKYFFDHLDRIAGLEYCPSTQDLLFLRVPTVGIVEVIFLRIISSALIYITFAFFKHSNKRKEFHFIQDSNKSQTQRKSQ